MSSFPQQHCRGTQPGRDGVGSLRALVQLSPGARTLGAIPQGFSPHPSQVLMCRPHSSTALPKQRFYWGIIEAFPIPLPHGPLCWTEPGLLWSWWQGRMDDKRGTGPICGSLLRVCNMVAAPLWPVMRPMDIVTGLVIPRLGYKSPIYQ